MSNSTGRAGLGVSMPCAAVRFYVLDNPTAQSAVPAQLSDIRGLQLVLNSASASPPTGRSTAQTFDLTAAVFFKNRMN